jgi:hypothetical protein
MDYTELGKYAENLMKMLVKGEIDEKEFVEALDNKITELKK